MPGPIMITRASGYPVSNVISSGRESTILVPFPAGNTFGSKVTVAEPDSAATTARSVQGPSSAVLDTMPPQLGSEIGLMYAHP